MYISRNLATLRENIYIILNYANKILVIYYTAEVYRNRENNIIVLILSY